MFGRCFTRQCLRNSPCTVTHARLRLLVYSKLRAIPGSVVTRDSSKPPSLRDTTPHGDVCGKRRGAHSRSRGQEEGSAEQQAKAVVAPSRHSCRPRLVPSQPVLHDHPRRSPRPPRRHRWPHSEPCPPTRPGAARSSRRIWMGVWASGWGRVDWGWGVAWPRVPGATELGAYPWRDLATLMCCLRYCAFRTP